MRKQKSFLFRQKLKPRRDAQPEEVDNFDQAVNNWIEENAEPEAPVTRVMHTVIRSDGVGFEEIIITLLIEYTPKLPNTPRNKDFEGG